MVVGDAHNQIDSRINYGYIVVDNNVANDFYEFFFDLSIQRPLGTDLLYDLNPSRIKKVFGNSARLITKEVINKYIQEFIMLLHDNISDS